MDITLEQRQEYRAYEMRKQIRFVEVQLSYAQENDKANSTCFDTLSQRHTNLLLAMDYATHHEMREEFIALVRTICLPTNGYLGIRGYWQESLKRIKQAVIYAAAMQHRSLGAQMASELGWLLFKMGNSHEAEKILQGVLQGWQASDLRDPDICRQIAGLHERLGVITRSQGKNKEAEVHLGESRRLKSQLKDPLTLAYAYMNQADLLQAQGNIHEALELYQQARAVFLKADNQSAIGHISSKLGQIAQRFGLTDWADDLMHNSLSIAHQLGDTENVTTRQFHLDRWAEGEDNLVDVQQQYEDRLREYRESGSMSGEANVLQALGSLAIKRGQFGDASTLLKQSLQLNEQMENWPNVANSHSLLGHLALAQKDFPVAEESWQMSLFIGQKLKDETIQAFAYLNLGRVAYAHGKMMDGNRLRREGLERLMLRNDLPITTLREIIEELETLNTVTPPRGLRQLFQLLMRFLR